MSHMTHDMSLVTYPDGLLLFEALHPAPPEDVQGEHQEEEGEDGERAGDDAQLPRVTRRESGDGDLLAHLQVGDQVSVRHVRPHHARVHAGVGLRHVVDLVDLGALGGNSMDMTNYPKIIQKCSL